MDPEGWRDRLPISLWLKHLGWARALGPPGALGDDLRAAFVAQRSAAWSAPPEERGLKYFLPPGRSPSDYEPWPEVAVLLR